METLATRLKRLRFESKMSQAEVAQNLGISPSTYRDWEYGRSIRGEPYVALANVFGLSLSELLTGKKAELDEELKRIESEIKRLRAEL